MSNIDPEDLNGDGNKDVWTDVTGDGIPDKIDFDGNGFPDGDLLDLNNDGVPDAINIYGMSETFYIATVPSSIAALLASGPRTSIAAPETTSTSSSSSPIATSSSSSSTPNPQPSPSTPETSISSSSTQTSDAAVVTTSTTSTTGLTSQTGIFSETTGLPASSSSSSSSPSPSNTSSAPPVGAIVGGAVGGLLAIAAILGFTWLIMRERRMRARDEAMGKAQVGGVEVEMGGIQGSGKVEA